MQRPHIYTSGASGNREPGLDTVAFGWAPVAEAAPEAEPQTEEPAEPVAEDPTGIVVRFVDAEDIAAEPTPIFDRIAAAHGFPVWHGEPTAGGTQ